MATNTFLLGGAALLYQADALENFDSAASVESDVTLKARGKRYAPLGPNGEVDFRRIVITGYHQSSFAFFITPYLNGREMRELRTFVSRPGPADGRETRFSIIVPVYRDSQVFAGVRNGLVGSTIDALIEITDPTARFDLESVDFLHEPLDDARNRAVNE